MYINSITSYRMGHKIVTDWGCKYNQWYGVEKHYVNNILMQKRFIIAKDKIRVVTKNRNLFGKFDIEA